MRFSKYNQPRRTKRRPSSKPSFMDWLERKGYLADWQELNEDQKKALEIEYSLI